MSEMYQPLAQQLAPQRFDDYVGQHHLVSPGMPLRSLIDEDKLVSLILWGPPGCGKTALARLISQITDAHFHAINAVMAKVADIRDAIELAKTNAQFKTQTILFIDEIHRFNKAQQDALLPDVEKGSIILIGATTENPFFSVNPSLLSRSQIFELQPLEKEDLEKLTERALTHPSIAETGLSPTQEIKELIISQSQGDARRLLNNIEMLATVPDLSIDTAKAMLSRDGVPHSEDAHYDIISAYIKSVRGSDPDAAVYWLARLLKGGEDPRFIARRLIILASEDIGNADPDALSIATSALQAVQFIGMPEAQLTLSQATCYLASAPKSNACTIAISRANALINEGRLYPVPTHLRDAHYKGAKKLGHGEGYKYAHDYPYAIAAQSYYDGTAPLYEPVERGFERTIKKRVDFAKKQRSQDTLDAENTAFDGQCYSKDRKAKKSHSD